MPRGATPYRVASVSKIKLPVTLSAIPVLPEAHHTREMISHHANTTPRKHVTSHLPAKVSTKSSPYQNKTWLLDGPRLPEFSQPCQKHLLYDLGKLIYRNSAFFSELGWKEFAVILREQGCFTSLEEVLHLSRSLLRQYKHLGDPVLLSGGNLQKKNDVLCLRGGAHWYEMDHVPLLWW